MSLSHVIWQNKCELFEMYIKLVSHRLSFDKNTSTAHTILHGVIWERSTVGFATGYANRWHMTKYFWQMRVGCKICYTRVTTAWRRLKQILARACAASLVATLPHQHCHRHRQCWRGWNKFEGVRSNPSSACPYRCYRPPQSFCHGKSLAGKAVRCYSTFDVASLH